MAEDTKIQWANHTFNPWRGCTKVAPGCANCYADRQSKRSPGVLGVWGPNGTRVVAAEAQWKLPLKWNRKAKASGIRARVFCASLADVFEDWGGMIRDSQGNCMWHRDDKGIVSSGGCSVDMSRGERWATIDDVRTRLFALIDATPDLDWQLVTKRPENIRKFWPNKLPDHTGTDGQTAYRHNVQLLTSISEQQTTDTNIAKLLECRDLCPVLGLSAEPLLGPVDLGRLVWKGTGYRDREFQARALGRRWIDWVIVGGESGPNARPCQLDWIRDLVHQCQTAKVPVFVKQVGSNPHILWPMAGNAGLPAQIDAKQVGVLAAYEELPKWRDPKGGDPSEWPADLRVREFPPSKQPQNH